MQKRLIVGVLVVLGGCDQKGAPEGVTLLSADSSTGLSGVFTAGDRTIFFETHHDARPAEAMQIYGLGPVEVSVRFTDAQGRMIASRADGHGLPPSWSEEPTQSNHVDQVALAARALAALELDPALELDRTTLLEVADGLAAARTEATPAISSAAQANYSTYLRFVQIFYKDLKKCVFGLCVKYGQHSATREYIWQDGVILGYGDHCNHGDCPSAGTLAYVTTCYGPYLANLWPVAAGDCTSSYNWSSLLGTHNCNDDTTIQIRRVVANAGYDLAGGICSDGSTHTTAPANCAP